jgi:cellobiose PTS system EIIB component
MKRILLLCAGGMSTSLLMNKMYKAAKDINMEIEIDARPISAAELYVDSVDIVLIGPQVRFQKDQVDKLVNGRIPVEIIDMKLYGTMNGKVILENVIKKIGR